MNNDYKVMKNDSNMYLSQKDIDEVKAMVKESNANESYEFETVFLSNQNSWTREDFTRLLDNCRKESCENGILKSIKEREKTLDISVGEFRITIRGKYYIDLYIQNKEILTSLPENSYTIIKKRPVKNHKTDFGLKFNLKNEIQIDKDDAEFAQAIVEWNRLGKSFRLKNRYAYLIHGIYSLDLTVVKAWKIGNQIARATTLIESKTLDAKESYEIELEYVPHLIVEKRKFDIQDWFDIVNKINCKLNNCFKYTSSSDLKQIKANYYKTLDPSENYLDKVLNQPISWTLQKYGISPQVVSMDMDKLRTLKNMNDNGYSVTLKSDGLRMIGFICTYNNKTELYLVASKSKEFISTGCLFDKNMHGTILDGEFMDKDKFDNDITDYVIFDCYYYQGKDVRQNNLLTGLESRLYFAQEALNSLNDTELLLNSIKFKVFVKEFQLINKKDIHSICGQWLNRVKSSIYENDGLIFTPEEAVGGNDLYNNKKEGQFVKSSGTFYKLLKWKDISMNSIDFKVVEENKTVEKIIQLNGHEKLVPCKSCILKVLYTNSWKPTIEFTRNDYIHSNDTYSNTDNSATTMEFMPYTPPDNQVCFTEFPLIDGSMRCRTSNGWNGQSFKNGDIVEMVYSPQGLKWIPIRVRKDKQNPNHFDVASNIWSLYFNPVTPEILQGTHQIPDAHSEDDAYYNQISVTNRALARKESGLRYFHCYVKGKILEKCFENLPENNRLLLDLACGKGGDLKRYLDYGASGVIGIDNSVDNLHNPIDGAYRRLWKLNLKNKNKIIWLAGDVSKNLSDTSTFITPYDKATEVNMFKVKPEFNVATVFFALHYFFESPKSVEIFLDNLVKTVKIGGYFGGCCYDGSKIFSKLQNKDSISFQAKRTEILKIEKKYDSSLVHFNPDDSSTGKKIRVLVQSIGVEHDEYLVNFDYLKHELAKRGFSEVSTDFFESYYSTNQNSKYNMEYDEQEASFLNRTFIFKREDSFAGKSTKVVGTLKRKINE